MRRDPRCVARKVRGSDVPMRTGARDGRRHGKPTHLVGLRRSLVRSTWWPKGSQTGQVSRGKHHVIPEQSAIVGHDNLSATRNTSLKPVSRHSRRLTYFFFLSRRYEAPSLHSKPKFPTPMGSKCLKNKGMGPRAAVAYWVCYGRQETFRRSKARCCTAVGVVTIWQNSSPI